MADGKSGVYTGYMHILLTLLNLIVYMVGLGCATSLFAVYDRKKTTLVNRKLKQA